MSILTLSDLSSRVDCLEQALTGYSANQELDVCNYDKSEDSPTLVQGIAKVEKLVRDMEIKVQELSPSNFKLLDKLCLLSEADIADPALDENTKLKLLLGSSKEIEKLERKMRKVKEFSEKVIEQPVLDISELCRLETGIAEAISHTRTLHIQVVEIVGLYSKVMEAISKQMIMWHQDLSKTSKEDK